MWFVSFPWNYGIVYGHILRAPSCTSEWRTASGVISRFDIDATSSWRRSRTSKGVHLSWSWTPSSLVLLYFSKFRTLVILLQVNLASGDELEIVCEDYYKTKDTFIFAWSSVPSVGHYRWLHGLIRRLPPNSKADYLVRTIWHILNFLQLWTIIVAYPRIQHVIATPRWAYP
jgi:hypothetical protein